jgi:hypothetical protein
MQRIFFSLLRRFGQQDEIHKHRQQSNPMEMLIEGFGSDWDVIEGQKRFKGGRDVQYLTAATPVFSHVRAEKPQALSRTCGVPSGPSR